MFENLIKFFNKTKNKDEKKETGKSKNAAKERLHLVLMQDRANVSADFLELMKQEIIDVIKKYIEVDEKAIDVRLTNKENEDGTNGAPALYANIPIVSIKNEARQVDKKQIEQHEEKTEIKQKEESEVKEEKQPNNENTEQNRTEENIEEKAEKQEGENIPHKTEQEQPIEGKNVEEEQKEVVEEVKKAEEIVEEIGQADNKENTAPEKSQTEKKKTKTKKKETKKEDKKEEVANKNK